MKAKAGQKAVRHTDALTLIRRADSASGVFEHEQVVATRNFAYLIKGRRQADLMNYQNRSRSGSYCFFDPTGVEIEGHRINVDEHGSGTDVTDRVGSGNERETRAEHFIAGTYAGRHKTQVQSRCAGRNRNSMLRTDELGKFPLKFGDSLALAEPAASQHLYNGFFFLRSDIGASNRNHAFVFSDDTHA
jgi:hypothetical protein